jgi:hypothetical protein
MPFSGPSELPRRVPDTNWATPTIDGTTNAPADGAALQAALNDVAASDPAKNHAVILPLGLELVGNFQLPTRAAGTGTVFIGPKSIFDGTFPRAATHYEQLVNEVQGQRVRHLDSFEVAGQDCFLPQVKSGTYLPAFSAAHGAHHYRIVGVEVGRTAANTAIIESALINLGGPQDTYTSVLADVPHHINVEHCIVKGALGYDTRRGIYANGAWIGIRDCSIYRIFEVGADAQCVAYWNSPGAISVLNCFLESGGENILGGGAGPVMDTYPDDFMKDVTVQWCHYTKDPTRSGIVKKNLDEHKDGGRKLVKSCLIEHNTGEAQDGTSMLYQCLNDSNLSPPHKDICDLTFDTVRIYGGGPLMALIGRAGYASANGALVWPLYPTRRVHVRNVYGASVCATLPEAAGCDTWLFQLMNGTQDLLIEHVTAEAEGVGFILNRATIDGVDTQGVTNFEMRDCLIGQGRYQLFSCEDSGGGSTGDAALVEGVGGTCSVHNNVFYLRAGYESLGAGQVPAGNFYVGKDAVGFAAWANQDPGALAASSPYHGAATDGADIGADLAAIAAMEAAVREVAPPWLPAGTPTPTPTPAPAPALASLALAPTSATVEVGQATAFAVSALDQFGAAFPVPSALAIQVDPAVASATQSGATVTAVGVAVGGTQLAVSSGGVTSNAAGLSVQAPPPPPAAQTLARLTLSPASVTCTVPVAATCQVAAFDQTGAPMPVPPLAFQATVGGKVACFTAIAGDVLTITPLTAGKARLWVTSGGIASNRIAVSVSGGTHKLAPGHGH